MTVQRALLALAICTSLASAATAKAESKAVSATALADVTALAEQCLLAELPDALHVVMRALAETTPKVSDSTRT